MKKNGLTKEFLEKHLELWKTKISKRKKWNELVLSYKVKHIIPQNVKTTFSKSLFS